MTNWMDDTVKQTKSLFVSAGHSYKDPGAYGNGYTEADIVLEFRDLVADALRHRVVFHKDGDRGENLPLDEAIARAKYHDIAVEFHCNAFKDPRANGVETLSQPKDYELGAALCEAVADTMGITNRGAKPGDAGAHSRLGFITKGHGIILELFFLTNDDDVRAYHSRKYDLSRAVGDVLIKAVSDGQA